MKKSHFFTAAAGIGVAASLKIVDDGDGNKKVISRATTTTIADAVTRTVKPAISHFPTPAFRPGLEPEPVPVTIVNDASPKINKNPRIALVAELNAHPSHGNWQAITRNSRTGFWFMAHSKTTNGSKEDVFIYRFDASGKYLDAMRIINGGHILSLSVSDDDVLWLTYGATVASMAKGELVTIVYRPGTTASRNRMRIMQAFHSGGGQISISPSRQWAVICNPWGTAYQFTLRKKEDILNKADKPSGHTIKIAHRASPLQGFSLDDECLFLLYGRDNGKAYIEKWWFKTGKKLGSVDVTNVGWRKGEKRDQKEPEGMDGRYFGMKVHGGPARRMRVYEHNI